MRAACFIRRISPCSVLSTCPSGRTRWTP
jgi:hypothetical protein